MTFHRRVLPAAVAAAFMVGAGAATAEIKLPDTIVWTAYDTGSSGYNQAVGIGSVLKNKYGVNLRVLPGKNDVSRLTPLLKGIAQFSATGSDSIYAQEAVYTAGTRDWGPAPVRLLLHNVADGCAAAMATAGDIGVKSIKDLKGKRVAWIESAPALNKAVEAMLAHGGLTWDDVVKVPVGGFGASIDGIINGDLDAANSATFSTMMVKMEASPRGLTFPPQPHGDAEGWKRLNAVVPWYFRHVCKAGSAIPPEGVEGIGTAYPILITTTTITEDVAYNMTKAMYEHFDDYKDSAPGANGWHWDRQKLEEVFLPFHDGAVRYYKEVGKWTEKAQANQDANLARQKVIQDAWKAYTASAPSDDEAFNTGWMKARADALRAAGMITVFETW